MPPRALSDINSNRKLSLGVYRSISDFKFRPVNVICEQTRSAIQISASIRYRYN